MHIQAKQLKPISPSSLTADENKILSWLQKAPWELQPEIREPTYKTKVPEFFGGVRLYNVQATAGAGAAQGPLALFIKKLEYQGALSKQEMHPLIVQGTARFVALKKSDLENLRAARSEDEE